MTTTDAVPAAEVAPSIAPGWELVVGLEVHAELATATKMFSSAPNGFAAEPNTNIDPTSLGLPGSLPVVNGRAVELAVRVGLALGCEVRSSIFARKNYFYPDMPKDYQISQYDRPINEGGRLELPGGKVIGVTRAHLEEDTGKNSHMGGDGRITGADYSLIDYNRAGVPLLEIVSEPDISTVEEARQYVEELRAILVAIGASDGKMEEGSLRVDANVSVRRPGEPLGTRCEIKNVNSLRSLGRAIEYEASRQIDLLTAGERVRQETRHWDETGGRTRTGRVKEDAEDYRYFAEPDLVPLDPDPAWIAGIREAMPLLPRQRRERLASAAGVEPSLGAVAVAVTRGLDELALAAIEAGADGRRTLTHVEHNLAVDGAAQLAPSRFAELLAMEQSGALTSTQAREVLGAMVDAALGGRDGDPAAIAEARGFRAMDGDELAGQLDALIAAHPDEWGRFCGGDPKERGKLTGFFVGQVMKATRGQADGKVVTKLLIERAGG